jgi:dipeptidyl aminopeptidase/acylaminoacyl peptidase
MIRDMAKRNSMYFRGNVSRKTCLGYGCAYHVREPWNRRGLLGPLPGAMLIFALMWLGPAVAHCETPAVENSTILDREAYKNTVSYEEWFQRAFSQKPRNPIEPPVDLQKARSYFSPALYKSLDGADDVTVTRITYASDGLRIKGFLVAPKRQGHPLPVVVWCRGGIAEFGMITTGDLAIMANWARRGYIVMASQYRGSTGSEGHDEEGGADVHDVLALIHIARQMPEVDADNMFLYGYSRGGMMAYQVLGSDAPIRAAVINSGVADFGDLSKRPDAKEFEALVSAAIPNFSEEKARGFYSRSAVQWPEKIHASVLILHCTGDWRVRPAQALHMALALQAANRPYDLIMLAGGVHVYLNGDQKALDTTILNFLDAHLASGKMGAQRP